MFPVIFIYLQCAGILKIFQMVLVLRQHLNTTLCIFIPRLGNFGQTLHFLFHRFQVLDLQLQVDGFNIPDRIHRSVDMGQLFIVKAPDHLDQRIGIPDIREKLVAHTFALIGPLGESGDIHDFDRGRNDFLGGLKILQVVKPGVGYINHPHI